MLLHHRFIYISKKHGNKLAIIDRTTGKRLTYSNSLIAALILADKLRHYEEGFTGIMIPTSAGAALSILAVLMSGRIPVMLNYSTGAANNIKTAQNKCNFKTVITSKKLLDKIGCPHVEGMVYIEDIMESITIIDKLKGLFKSKLAAPLLVKSVAPGNIDDNAVILFTSGSEKDPKAVQLTHRNIVSNIEGFSDAFALSERDSVLANLPYFHVLGLTVNLWMPLYHGMTMIAYASPLEYKEICDIIREEKPSLVVGTPSFLWGYLRKSEKGDFKSVRVVMSGADKCPDALREGFLEKHNLVLYEGYGTTETSPVISVNNPEANRKGSVGRVLPNVQIRIEKYETGEECKTGETGRILVKGELVMKGYFDDIEETSMRIRSGWYDTGDMGYLDEDNFLWHVGRLKRFVKIGGEMISLVQIETVLEKLLPVSVSCCVVDIPDAIKGAKIIAAVTEKINEKEITKHMSEYLPNIALPKQFTVIEELPKMGSGKVDFRKIADIVKATIHGKS